MNYDTLISKAIKQNDITKILMVDDVFDPPTINNLDMAALDHLLISDLIETLRIDTNNHAVIDSAKQAMDEGDFQEDRLSPFISVLYKEYIKELDNKFDVGGHFKNTKLPSLKKIQPLVNLIRSLGDQVEIKFVGLEGADTISESFKPQLIFIDYFLSPLINEEGKGEPKDANMAVEASKNIIKHIYSYNNSSDDESKSLPSIILMSSADLDEEAVSYRHSVNQLLLGQKRITSWRFAFIKKDNIQEIEGGFDIKAETADSIIDVCGSYQFGMKLYDGINKWKTSAKEALEDSFNSIEELDIKDFAYLIRFRLREESQLLSSYLRWLFGEHLLENINRQVSVEYSRFRSMDDLSVESYENVLGAYDGPTSQIAKMFDMARIEREIREPADRFHKRLGDIYRIGKSLSIKVIISPDCDLVDRSDGKGPTTRYPLTIEGKLIKYKSPSKPLSDFIIADGHSAFLMDWSFDTIESTRFEDFNDDNNLIYMGTLKPVYAQEIQKKALNHIGRVGVAVAPFIGVSAKVRVQLRKVDNDNKWYDIQVGNTESAQCTISLPRGTPLDKHMRVLFFRKFLSDFIDELGKVDPTLVSPQARQLIADSRKPEQIEEIRKGFMQMGLSINSESKGPLGICAVSSDGTMVKGCCRLIVEEMEGGLIIP